ncbi:MAG: PIN domain-containing protein [Candidatus Accumulibacter sp.]|jgi:predicted nucleic acid-binding protein|nr:PIN domain-containing protein [Accumulibacter sp.]
MGKQTVKVLLDTNLLIDDLLDHPGHAVYVSSLSWAELQLGIVTGANVMIRAAREARLARLKNILGPGLPFDDAAATAYATVARLILERGRNPKSRAIDLMIAATALAHGAGIITRNSNDFAGLESLIKVFPV